MAAASLVPTWLPPTCRKGLKYVIDALFRHGSAANLSWLENQSANGQFHFIQVDLADVDVMAVFLRHARLITFAMLEVRSR